MLEARTRWIMNDQADDQTVQLLMKELRMDPLIARLLSVRGISTVQQAKDFLELNVGSFHDPFLLKGMDRAVERIHTAIEHREKIRIYGDYDADGVCSTALMTHIFRQLDANFDYYIPHRVNEGYGLNLHSIDHAKKNGVTLIVTVDNGISAHEEIHYAIESGIDVIVTDHHEPPPVLPDAYAIVNPKQPDCPYPFKDLAGVGVALKLAHALLGEVPLELTQIAAIGTVADLMPLVGENRLIVKLGLDQIHHQPIVGVKALCGVSKLDCAAVTASHIGFAIGPRINASGRLESAKEAMQLLITSNEQEAEHLAYHLDQLNRERQTIVDEIKREAIQLLEQSQRAEQDAVLVIAQENWNVGVIGIVASKILEIYYKPVIIFSIDPESGLAKGSARSIAGFDIYKALTECKECLVNYGGHQMAAGMTIHRENITTLREQLHALANEWLSEDDFIPMEYADMECGIHEFSMESIERIQRLAPFGQGNPPPRFMFNQLRIHDLRTIGKDQQHLKFTVSQAVGSTRYTMDAIAFGQGNRMHSISPAAKIDILGEVSIHEWNGIRKPQLMVRDFRITERQIFDWRRLTFSELVSRFMVSGREPAIVIFNDRLPSKHVQELSGMTYTIWTLDEDGEPIRLDGSHSTPLSECRDVVIYSLPPELSWLQSVIRCCASVERLYLVFANEGRSRHLLPSRQSFKTVYAILRQQKEWPAADPKVLHVFSQQTGISMETIQFVIAVFEELAFVEKDGTSYRCVSRPQKRDLNTSRLYQQRMHHQRVVKQLLHSSTQELIAWMGQQMKLNELEE